MQLILSASLSAMHIGISRQSLEVQLSKQYSDQRLRQVMNHNTMASLINAQVNIECKGSSSERLVALQSKAEFLFEICESFRIGEENELRGMEVQRGRT